MTAFSERLPFERVLGYASLTASLALAAIIFAGPANAATSL